MNARLGKFAPYLLSTTILLGLCVIHIVIQVVIQVVVIHVIDARGQGLGDLPPVTKTSKPKPAAPARPRVTPTPKPRATPKPSVAARPTPTPPPSLRRAPATTPAISFNTPVEAALNTSASGRITATDYYDEFLLGATTADLFTITLEGGSPGLQVQIYDQNQNGQPILRDPQSGQYRLSTPGGTLPADGAWRIRVLGSLTNTEAAPIPYTLSVRRTGLTEEGYQTRLEKIVSEFGAAGAGGDKPTEAVDKAIRGIEELIAIDDDNPRGYETLAGAYLYFRRDLPRAVNLMEKAIKLGGAAMFRVEHDSQWRRPVRQGAGFEFEDKKISWLKIRHDQATLVDVADQQRIYFSVGSRQINDVSREGRTAVVQIKPPGLRAKPWVVRPFTRDQGEADIIVNMIKSYVQRKG